LNKKLVAIAIVAVIIVSSVGVGYVIMANDNKNSSATSVEGSLEIYGNANNDYVLDEQDATLIQNIIDQNLDWETYYPFADANYDGVVDSSDVTYVQSIMDATTENKVTIYHNNQNPDGKYVVDTKYPITSTLSSTSQTTIIVLKTLGIYEEIKGVSYQYAESSKYDKYIYEDYFDLITSEYRISNTTVGVNVDTASNFVTNYGCSAYIYSSASSTLSNSTAVEGAGIDLIQIGDSMSDIGDFTSAILLLGFLFGNSDNEYQETAIDFADWITIYSEDLEERLESVTNGTVTQVSGVASSMVQYISVKGSSNTNVIEEAGVYCPVANKISVGATTLKYVGGTDTWLNYIDIDYLVVLKGSTDGWSWFDKDYANLPTEFTTHLNNYSTLKCCTEGNAIIVSTMMPAPLKSGVLAEYMYPELFEDGWIESYLTDFFMEFWGWSADDCDGLRYYLTQEEVLG
jgi:hypothetical protein